MVPEHTNELILELPLMNYQNMVNVQKMFQLYWEQILLLVYLTLVVIMHFVVSRNRLKLYRVAVIKLNNKLF